MHTSDYSFVHKESGIDFDDRLWCANEAPKKLKEKLRKRNKNNLKIATLEERTRELKNNTQRI